MSFLSMLMPPRTLPPPDPRCRTYTFAETVVLLRNHERQMRMSRELHKTPENKPQ